MLVLNKSLENQREELHASRVETSKLKMHIEGSGSGKNLVVSDVDNFQPESIDKYKEEIKKLQMEIEGLKEKNKGPPENGIFVPENEIMQTEDKVIEIHEDQGAISHPVEVALDVVQDEDAHSPVVQTLNYYADKHKDSQHTLFDPANANSAFESIENVSAHDGGKQEQDSRCAKSGNVDDEAISEKKVSPFYLRKSSNIFKKFFLTHIYMALVKLTHFNF